MKDPRQSTKIAVLLARFADPGLSVYYVARISDDFLRHAEAYARLQVKACNERLTDRDFKRRDRLINKMIDCLGVLNVRAFLHFGGDPRGYTVRIEHPSIPKDAYDNYFGVA